VPGNDTRVRGVVQDRGRVVVVMAHPTGQSRPQAPGDPKRIVICETPRGHVGVPATTTAAVESLNLPVEPTSGSVYDSERGPFVYLDPSSYVSM
jgi:hypothetical protein